MLRSLETRESRLTDEINKMLLHEKRRKGLVEKYAFEGQEEEKQRKSPASMRDAPGSRSQWTLDVSCFLLRNFSCFLPLAVSPEIA